MTFKDKLIVYISRASDKADEEYLQHINFYRYHKADQVDHLESIILKTRRDTFAEVLDQVLLLMATEIKKTNYTK